MLIFWPLAETAEFDQASMFQDVGIKEGEFVVVMVAKAGYLRMT